MHSSNVYKREYTLYTGVGWDATAMCTFLTLTVKPAFSVAGRGSSKTPLVIIPRAVRMLPRSTAQNGNAETKGMPRARTLSVYVNQRDDDGGRPK